MANLTAFAKVLGYVRHFHPSDQAAAVDLGFVRGYGVSTIEAAGTTEMRFQ